MMITIEEIDQRSLCMKNILFISPTGGYAGIDVCLEGLVYGIDKSKFNPIVVFPTESKLKSEFEHRNIKCYSLPLNWWFPIGFSGNDIMHVLPTMRDKVDPLVHIINDNNIDIVFSNTSVNLDGMIAASICNKPHVFFLHAKFVDNIYTTMDKETKAFIYQLMGKMSDTIVCCSQFLNEFILNYSENSICIYNGVDTDKFSFKKRSFVSSDMLSMICVGHYNANKQQDFVLKALKHLKDINLDIYKKVKFTMVGPGEPGYINKLKDMVLDFGIKEQVSFEDFRDDISEYINSFIVYINSSITENLPISVIEAMSNGMPVLATPNDGTMQLVVNEETGYISKTPLEMAKRIIDIFNNPDLIEKMSTNSRKRVCENFSLEKYIANFEELFDSIKPIDKEDNFVHNFYESLVGYSLNKLPRIDVLVIYPKAAMATFYIAAKNPLDYLEKLGKVRYKYVSEEEFKNDLIDECDIVYCIRYYHEFAYNALQYTQNSGRKFVWFIDDNYFALNFKNGNVIHEKTHNILFQKMFEDSDAVIVNSDELYHVGNVIKSKIFRLPTYQLLADDIQVEFSKPKDVIRFGFMGTLKRDDDFACVVKAILKIQQIYNDKIEIDFIGYYPEELKDLKNVNIFDFMVDYNEFRKFFKERDWDFGIAPLRDTNFNKSKTNNKYREYSALRIPGVFSNIKTYNTCIKNGINGLLVDNDDMSWFNAIERMINDESLRFTIAENAHNDILENYSIDRFAKPLMKIFSNLRYENIIQPTLKSRTFKQSRIIQSDILVFPNHVNKKRKYNVYCDINEVSEIGIIFTSYYEEIKGIATLKVIKNGRILRTSTIELGTIDFNCWTYFEFKTVYNCGGAVLTLELEFEYHKGAIGVYEDVTKRNFMYRLFNKIGKPLKGLNNIYVDLR